MRIHSVEGEPKPPSERKGIFARILEALHRARRREALRVLRRYRHLIAGQAQIRPAKPAPKSLQSEKSIRHGHGNNPLARADRTPPRRTTNRFA